MTTLTSKAVLTARVRLTNEGDENRKYEMTADITVKDGAAQEVQNGYANKDGATVATFNRYGRNVSVTWQTEDAEEQTQALEAVQGFMADITAWVAANAVTTQPND